MTGCGKFLHFKMMLKLLTFPFFKRELTHKNHITMQIITLLKVIAKVVNILSSILTRG